MRHILQLAATLTLLTAATTHAQITNPDNLVGKPPRNPATSKQAPTQDLQWLSQYATLAPQGSKPALLADPRFLTLLQDNFKAPQSMWGIGIPLSEAAHIFLSGEGTIASADNRHLTLTGCVVTQCAQRGLLYTDLRDRNPLLIFSGLRWNEQGKAADEPGAAFNLWIFPSRALDPDHLPQAFKDSLNAFLHSTPCRPIHINSVLLVDPTGIPHILGTLDTIPSSTCITTPL